MSVAEEVYLIMQAEVQVPVHKALTQLPALMEELVS